MSDERQTIIVVGGGTSGAVMAARLSEKPENHVILLEAGPGDDVYDDVILDPSRAADAWMGAAPIAPTPMQTAHGMIPIFQGRVLGGTSAINGMATLRGLPEDYDAWAAAGLEGWGWQDVVDTFIRAERDLDFGQTPLHGAAGPLPVRRWRGEELSRAQRAFYDGMVELGVSAVTDVNTAEQLPGIGVFPVTIDESDKRVSTSLAYLTLAVRARENLDIRTSAAVERIEIEGSRAKGVILASGETLDADEVIVTAGAIFSPLLLMRSGVGPADHLADHGITVHADLPVGSTMSDHLGVGIPYRHVGPRGGSAGPAQVVLVGASNGKDVDYHAFPIAQAPAEEETHFNMAVFLLRSSGQGSVRLGDNPAAEPVIVAPPLPADGHTRLRHAFDQVSRCLQTPAAQALGSEPVEPFDWQAADAVERALERNMLSYGHMTSTCPMGTVLDADCRVLGMEGLRVADASVMPTIPSGNTYLGCVMVAERIAQKMLEAS